MSLNNSAITQSVGVPYQEFVTSSLGHTLVSNNTYFNDTSDNIPRYKDADGTIFDVIISSSYALTSSHALDAKIFPFTGSAIISGSLDVTGSLDITGSVGISLTSGSAFSIEEPDNDQQGRLDFSFTQGDPVLEIGSRTNVGYLNLRKGFTGDAFKIGSDGTFAVDGTTTIQLNASQFKPNATNTIDLGVTNRRFKDVFLYSGAKLGWSANTAADLVALKHIGGTNTLEITGSSPVDLDIKGNTRITGSLDVTGDVTASAFKGDGSALTGIVKTTGTPADNQIPIFTDSNTIEGTSSFTYNSTTRELLLGASSAGSTETNTLRIQGYSGASSAFLKLGWNNWGGTTIESGFNGTTELYSYGTNATSGGRLILGEGGDTGANQLNYLWIRGDNQDDSVHIYMGANSTTYSSEIGIERQEGTGVNYESDIALRAAAGLSGHKSEYIFSRKGMFQAQDAGFTVSGSGQVFVNTTASLINPTTKITGFDQALVVNGDITASGLFATTANITGSFKGNGSALTNLKVGSNPARVVFTTTDGELTTESGFDYNSTTNQLTVNSINVVSFTSSFITSSTIESSGSHTFGDSTSDTQTLVGTMFLSGSTAVTGSLNVDGNVVTSTTGKFIGPLEGNADTSTKIASITNSNIVQLTSTQALTNKDLTGAGNTFPTFNQNTTGTAAGLSSTLVVGSGGTGLTALGSANQVLSVNAAGNALEYTTPTTGDVTEVTSATTDQITVANSTGPNPAISAVTGTIANGETSLATADQIHTFVTTQTDTTAADTSGNAATATNVAYTGLTGTVPTWNQNTSGTAASLSATLITGRGGTGLTTIGTAGQVLTVNAGANGLEYTTPSAASGTVTSVGTTGTVNGITLTGGDITTTGTVTLGGTLAISNADWSGTDLSVANGGTGASTFTAGRVLIGNGTSAITTDSGFTYSSNKLTTEALKITEVSEDEETSRALMIDNASAGDVVFRTLGTNAFSSATIYTYDLNATQDGNNVDINLTSAPGTDTSVVQLTAGPNVTLDRVSAAEVAVSASGLTDEAKIFTWFSTMA